MTAQTRTDVSGAIASTPIAPLTEAELAFLDRAAAVDGAPAISGGLLAIATGEDTAHEAQTRSTVWRVFAGGAGDARGSVGAGPDSDAEVASSEGRTLVGIGVRALQGERHAAEFVIDPDHRGQGLGEELLSAILAEEPATWCWSHGDHPAAQRLAEAHGLGRERVLFQMRTDDGLSLADLPEPVIPAGVTLRSFAPGDEEGWMGVNNRAFDWHPEQGGQTTEDYAAITQASDFDPDSVVIAVRDGEIIGFHQTHVGPAGSAGNGTGTSASDGPDDSTGNGPDGSAGGNDRLGEVYVVGVDPRIHAKGVGRALTVEGMRRMVAAGASAIELYVESDNEPALGLYRRLGFHVAVAHVSYAPASPTHSTAR